MEMIIKNKELKNIKKTKEDEKFTYYKATRKITQERIEVKINKENDRASFRSSPNDAWKFM